MRGPEIRYRFRQTIDGLDRELRDLRAVWELSSTKSTGLVEQRERLFHELTRIYLPELGREVIDDLKRRLPAMHRRVDGVLRAKHAELRRLDEGRNENAGRRRGFLSKLDVVTEQIEELAVERDRLTEKVGKELAADPRHGELARSAEQSRLRREQAQRRYDEAVLERDEKLPEYEQDPLFGYLLRKHYDTPQYNPSGLARRLDRWVANKVSFRGQNEKFRLLQEIPDVAQAGLEADDRDYEQAAAKLRGLEKSIEDLHGLTRVVERGDAIRKAGERLEELESNRGQYYEEARDALSEFLESRPIPQLREIALSTATRKDDRLAAELERWDEEWAAVGRRLRDVEGKEQSISVRLDELRKIDHRFRKKDFDASNSTFAQALDLDGLLKSFLAGGLTVAKLWKAIAGSQRFEPTRYQQAGPVIEAVLWEVLRHSGGFRGGGGGGWGGGGGGTTGGFGGFGGGSGTTGGFG